MRDLRKARISHFLNNTFKVQWHSGSNGAQFLTVRLLNGDYHKPAFIGDWSQQKPKWLYCWQSLRKTTRSVLNAVEGQRSGWRTDSGRYFLLSSTCPTAENALHLNPRSKRAASAEELWLVRHDFKKLANNCLFWRCKIGMKYCFWNCVLPKFEPAEQNHATCTACVQLRSK